MRLLPYVPEGAAVDEVLDGHWLLRLSAAASPIRVTLEAGAGQDWWVLRQAAAPGLVTSNDAAAFARLFDLMATYPAVKVILSAGRGAELRVEFPAADSNVATSEGRWMQILIDQLGQANGRLSEAASLATTDAGGESLEQALTDLGHAFEAVEPLEPAEPTLPDATLTRSMRLQLPVADATRLVEISRTPGWVHLHICSGISSFYPAEEPMHLALLTYLLRIGAHLRLARASYRPGTQSAPAGGQARFEVDLPTPITSACLQHGLAALATAVKQFEQEIEHLATEAILARAYLAINGAPEGATHNTLEL